MFYIATTFPKKKTHKIIKHVLDKRYQAKIKQGWGRHVHDCKYYLITERLIYLLLFLSFLKDFQDHGCAN
jgi:hypothetical protein